jgi:hypothetical protein
MEQIIPIIVFNVPFFLSFFYFGNSGQQIIHSTPKFTAFYFLLYIFGWDWGDVWLVFGTSKIAQRMRNDLLTLELYASAEDAGRGLNEQRHRTETAVVDDVRLSSE